MNISDRTFLALISLMVVAAIASTAYIFLVQKDYEFVIEAPCDPVLNTCFYRDCVVEECPLNELEYYRVFSVPASVVAGCDTDGCAQECAAGTVSCSEYVCGESEEDICSAN